MMSRGCSNDECWGLRFQFQGQQFSFLGSASGNFSRNPKSGCGKWQGPQTIVSGPVVWCVNAAFTDPYHERFTNIFQSQEGEEYDIHNNTNV